MVAVDPGLSVVQIVAGVLSGSLVLVIALIALTVNVVTALLVRRMPQDDVTIRAAFVQNVMDVYGAGRGDGVGQPDPAGREIGPVGRALLLAVPGGGDAHHLHLWMMGEHEVSLPTAVKRRCASVTRDRRFRCAARGG